MGKDLGFVLSIIENNRTDSLEKTKIYRCHILETDLSVHLLCNSDRVEPKENTVVHHLTKFLKEYGLVNPSIWIEDDTP
jgi:hypothetical protein